MKQWEVMNANKFSDESTLSECKIYFNIEVFEKNYIVCIIACKHELELELQELS